MRPLTAEELDQEVLKMAAELLNMERGLLPSVAALLEDLEAGTDLEEWRNLIDLIVSGEMDPPALERWTHMTARVAPASTPRSDA